MKINKANQRVLLVSGILFTTFALGAYLIFGVYIANNTIDTVGTFQYLEKYQDSDGDTAYRSYITYELDGETITGIMPLYQDKQPGDEIKFYYYINDPTDLGSRSQDNLILYLCLFFFGGIAILCFACYPSSNYRMHLNRLKRNGKCIQATYVGTARHPKDNKYWQIICTWIDPETQREYYFKSTYLTENPATYLDRHRITELPVYYTKPNRESGYEVDLEPLLAIVNGVQSIL